MPAAMDGHTIDDVCSKKTPSIFVPLPPGGIIGERCDHLDVIAPRVQKFTQRDVVRPGAGAQQHGAVRPRPVERREAHDVAIEGGGASLR